MLPDPHSLSAEEFWIWTGVLTAFTLAGLYFAFRNLLRARIIEDTPTSRIRSAPQGYVELSGEAAAMQGEPILSPLTMTPCCWYRVHIERKDDKGWDSVRKETSDGLFLIRDDTGECIIDPEAAEVTPYEKTVWYGDNATPVLPKADYRYAVMTPVIGLTVNFSGGGNYRFTEEAIYPGNPLYAIGLFKTFGEVDRMAMRDDLIRARLAEWKQDQASLLQRFDRNRDGRIDLVEWEDVRRSATRAVDHAQAKEPAQQLNTLGSTGSRRRPFLISAKGEFNLIKRYRYFAGGSISAFFLFGGAAVWLIAHRLF